MHTTRTKPQDVPFPNHHPAYVLSSWFWSGKLPWMPGTWGSCAALPFWYVVWLPQQLWLFGAVLVLIFVLGAVAVTHITRRIPTPHAHDASVFVVDEVVGQGIALLPVLMLDWHWWLIALGSFRVLDILKPWPANQLDRTLHNGWGTMLDDVVAGAFAAGIVWVGLVYLG